LLQEEATDENLNATRARSGVHKHTRGDSGAMSYGRCVPVRRAHRPLGSTGPTSDAGAPWAPLGCSSDWPGRTSSDKPDGTVPPLPVRYRYAGWGRVVQSRRMPRN
jgi:hypothetical protein